MRRWTTSVFYLGLLGIAFSEVACSTPFRSRQAPSRSSYKRLARNFQFLEIPRIGLTGVQAVAVEGSCRTSGARVDFQVPGTRITGSTTCQIDARSGSLFWKSVIDFSTCPDGAIVLLVHEVSGLSRMELGILELKKDTAFCDQRAKNASAHPVIPGEIGEFQPFSPEAITGPSTLAPISICSTKDWNDLATAMATQPVLQSAQIQLRNHLDFEGTVFKPMQPFKGEFVGGGFFIRNATINGLSGVGVGIFGDHFEGTINAPTSTQWIPQVDSSSLYLGLENIRVRGFGSTENATNEPVGTLMGTMDRGRIENVWVRYSQAQGKQFVGGLIGRIQNQTPPGTAVIKNVFIESTGVHADQQHAGGFAGEIGSQAEVFDTKLLMAEAQAPHLSGGLAGINRGLVTRTLALRTGATDPHVDFPTIDFPIVNITEAAGGLIGWNTSTGILSHTMVNNAFAVAGLNPGNAEATQSINIGGVVGINDGVVAEALFDATFAHGVLNVSSGIGLNRGTVRDVAASEFFTLTPYDLTESYSSVGGFVGRHESGTILRSYAFGRILYRDGPAFEEEPGEPMACPGCIAHGFFGALGGNTQSPPIMNGALLMFDPSFSTQIFSSNLTGFQVLESVDGSGQDDRLYPQNYVFFNDVGQPLRWNDPSVKTTNLVCGAPKEETIWVMPHDGEMMDTLPRPRVIEHCP